MPLESTDIAFNDPAEESDEEILSELLERTSYMLSRWNDIRRQGDLNMKALSIVGPWPEEELTARSQPENMRPHGHTDIISQYNNRVVNQWRMNPRGVKVDQSGSGATDQTAELREDRIREIAYASQAKAARLCAFQNAVDRGYGAWEVYAEYESPRTSRQRICVGAIQNPNSVLVDPDTAKLDRSDMKYAVKMGKVMTKAEFQRKYKQAKDISSFPPATLGLAKNFTDGKTVTPAEYFRVVTKDRVLLSLDDGSEVFQDELREGLEVSGKFIMENGRPLKVIVKQRDSETAEVQHFITNGLEILKRETLMGSTIPIIFVVAREKYENDVLTIEALTSKMREPQLNFDVARAAQVEAMNMVPKSKWVVSDEQILGYEDQWKNAHRNPQAFLVVHEYDRNGRQMAHPERTDFEPPVQGMELVANSFVRDAQNTIGMASAERVDRVAKSGVAQDKLQQTADIANYHLVDNMIMAVEYEGRIENEWLSLIEDSERTVGLRKPDGKYKTYALQPTEDQNGNVQHPYGPADSHAVTISTGPDYQSQKEAKDEFLKQIVGEPGFVQNPLSPMVIHEMELGPGGDKMEKVALAVQPPAVQAAYQEDDGSGQPPPSPQAVQQIEQMKQELTALNEHAKGLEAQIAELLFEKKAETLKLAQEEKNLKLKLQVDIDKATIAASVKENVEAMAQHVQAFKHIADVLTEKLSMDHEATQNELDRQHEAGLQAQNLGAAAASQDSAQAHAADQQQQQLAVPVAAGDGQ